MKATMNLTGQQQDALMKHLFPGDGKEAVAVALCGRRAGDRSYRLTVRELFMIPYEQCSIRTPVNVRWTTDLIVDLLEKAEKHNLSVVKIHSHPTGIKQFSAADDQSDRELLPTIRGWVESDILHGSVVVLPTGEMFGRYLNELAEFKTIDRIMIVGDEIKVWDSSAEPSKQASFAASHAQLFGEKTVQEFGNLSIGIVGCSGTGSPVIEQLVRLGVGELVLVDHDHMTKRNVNRILNSTMRDAECNRPKVEMLTERIEQMGLGTKVIPIQKNLWDPESVKEIAQCDILFGCMDSVDGRFLLNTLATYYILPYFDVGIRLDAVPSGIERGKIREVCGTVHYLQPGLSSLMSRGLVDMKAVAAAGLARSDAEAYEQQMKDGYITGVQENRPAVITVNMLLASLAVNELLCRLHPYREEPNSNFASVEVTLSSMEIYPDPEETICKLLSGKVGYGDVAPLLNLPELG